MADAAKTPNGNRRPPASTDVAKLAGVSQKTVSRVMNGEPLVSQEVRERVLQAARELGYRRNEAARALTLGRSYRIGFVSLGTSLHGPIATLVAVEQAARRRGYSLSITTTSAADPGGTAGAIDVLLQQGSEAIVILEPIDEGDVEIDVEIPVLVFGHVPGLRARPVLSVQSGGDRSAEIATSHLLSLGHETVHHIGGPQAWYAARERSDGWRRALERAGAHVPERVEGDWSAASGYAAAQSLIAHSDVTAIFCANDDMAFGAIKALADAGRSVPGDVSVVGFDDVPNAPFSLPALTTIRHPFEEVGALGIDALIGVIENPDTYGAEIPEPVGELVVRDSAGPARADGASSGGDRRR